MSVCLCSGKAVSDRWVWSVGLHCMVWRVHLHQVWQRVLNQSCSEITLYVVHCRETWLALCWQGRLRWASSPVKWAGPMRSSGKEVREYIICQLEFTIRKSDWVKVHHEKKSDGVRAHHKKEWWGENLPWQKEQWGKTSLWERAMRWEFIMRKSDGVRVHHKEER